MEPANICAKEILLKLLDLLRCMLTKLCQG